jgi:hypothetical protein
VLRHPVARRRADGLCEDARSNPLPPVTELIELADMITSASRSLVIVAFVIVSAPSRYERLRACLHPFAMR